jgi:hypothetical protein
VLSLSWRSKVTDGSELGENAGFLAWNISKSLSTTRYYGRESQRILIAVEASGRASLELLDECRSIVAAIAAAAEATTGTWDRITSAVAQSDPELFEPPERGVTVIRNHGPDAALCDQIREIWGDGPRTPWELFERLEEATGMKREPDLL